MVERWYAVRTDPRSEDLASQALTRYGVENYLPKARFATARYGYRLTPIFPGYLFVKWDEDFEQTLRFGHSTRCIGWVNFGGVIPNIPDQIMAELSAKVESLNTADGLWQMFREGEMVQLTSNGIDSIAEVLESPRSPDTLATVLFQFMGRLVKAKVPWEDITPMEMSDSPRIRTRGTRGNGRRIQ